MQRNQTTGAAREAEANGNILLCLFWHLVMRWDFIFLQFTERNFLNQNKYPTYRRALSVMLSVDYTGNYRFLNNGVFAPISIKDREMYLSQENQDTHFN